MAEDSLFKLNIKENFAKGGKGRGRRETEREKK